MGKFINRRFFVAYTNKKFECYMELIVERDEVDSPPIAPNRTIRINERFEIWYYNDEDVPPLSVGTYSYAAIPKCFAPCSSEALEVSGILTLQRQENLHLTGKGVYIGIADSGLNLWDSAFRNDDGSTKVDAFWDQERDIVYREEDINRILFNDNNIGNEVSRENSVQVELPQEGESQNELQQEGVSQNELPQEGESQNELLQEGESQNELPQNVLPRDEDGHGTFLASLAAGRADLQNDFTGAAPDAKLIVVKLKQASKQLRDFFFIPDNVTVYSEADVMRAVAFIENTMETEHAFEPLVIMLGIGCNNGSHCGTLPLSQYLDSIAILRNRAVVMPGGNEGIAQHHFKGRVSGEVEINVEKDIDGFYFECWSLAPERAVLSIRSPNGEIRPTTPNMDNMSQSYRFALEGTSVTIDYRYVGRRRRDQLIFVRFENVPRGVWSITVNSVNSISGEYNIWLPAEGLLSGPVFFLAPDPDTTITSPGDSVLPMTVGGYSLSTGGVYLESGRGFLADGTIKPDFIAPCDEITGKGLRDNYVTYSGSSAAAAITAGACAQILEWAVVENNAPGINSIDIKNFLIRGAVRLLGYEYPSKQAGYGRLEIYESFRQI